MKKPNLILNIFLAILAIAGFSFSAFLYKQKVDLAEQLKQKQFQIDVEEEENQKLTSENEAMKRDVEANKELQQNFTQIKADLEDKLKAGEDKVATLEADLKDVQWKLEQLKTENTALSKENESLKAQAKDSASKVQQPQSTPGSSKVETEPPKKKFIFF
jgi:uncharacterized protein (DUF3084 family)